MADPPDTADPQYSRAFETFVDDPNDLVGLVAYALYKQTIREAAVSGRPMLQARHGFATATERAAYRGDAERRLQAFASDVTDQATPGIVARGVGLAVEAAKIELLQALNRRTSFWSAIVSNLVAWVITLAVTVLLLASIYLPNWQADLIAQIRAAQSPPATLAPAPPPAMPGK